MVRVHSAALAKIPQNDSGLGYLTPARCLFSRTDRPIKKVEPRKSRKKRNPERHLKLYSPLPTQNCTGQHHIAQPSLVECEWARDFSCQWHSETKLSSFRMRSSPFRAIRDFRGPQFIHLGHLFQTVLGGQERLRSKVGVASSNSRSAAMRRSQSSI